MGNSLAGDEPVDDVVVRGRVVVSDEVMTLNELDLPTDRYGLIRRHSAVRAGFTDHELSRRVAAGTLRRVGRGTFLVPATIDRSDTALVAESAVNDFRLTSIALVTGANSNGRSVLSHESAAAMHGLGMLKPALGRVHVTTGTRRGGQVRKAVHSHASELSPDDVVVIDGIRVTSLARTATDLAQSVRPADPLAFAKALVVLDGALRAGASSEALTALLKGARRGGTRCAKSALSWADGGAESVGESWGRAQLIQAGLRVPKLQVEHVIGGRTYRVDGDWDGKLAWEFDGFTKYLRYRKPGESIADAVWREKQREDALRSAGIMVIRAWWAMLERGTLPQLVASWLDRLGLR